MSERKCTTTGFWINDDFRSGVRIATTNRGPLDPWQRLAGEDRDDWNRYDTPGSTVYLSDTDEIAFAEVLSSYALTLGQEHPLQKDADFIGMSLQDYVQTIDDEWGNQIKSGCLPAHWRDRRNTYQLALQGGGWWVDVEHPDSIAAIKSALGQRLHKELGLQQLTLGVLHGEDRGPTTMIAEWVRGLVLDDGSHPLGITFQSKHGGGRCWAYWLRRRDAGLTERAMLTVGASFIQVNDPALLRVSNRFGIKVW